MRNLRELLVIGIMVLSTTFLYTQDYTCGLNCDMTYTATSASYPTWDFNSGSLPAGADGMKTVCLHGNEGGFAYNGNLGIKNATDRLYVCPSNNATNITITGALTTDGAAIINVKGNSSFSNFDELKQGAILNVDAGVTLNMTKASRFRLNVGTINNNGTLNFLNDLDGNHGGTLNNYGVVDVALNSSQDYALYNFADAFMYVHGNLSMEYYFKNTSGIFVDGSMIMAQDQASTFDGGYFVSNSFVYSGNNTFDNLGDCGMFISKNPVVSNGSAVTITTGNIAVISLGGIDSVSGGSLNGHKKLENAGFTLGTPITSTDKAEFLDYDFQQFIKTVGCQSNVLPIKLSSFKVEPTFEGNEVSWKTTSEVNSNYIIVQKAYDAISFQDEEYFYNDGNDSYSEKKYRFLDKDVASLVYYRLKQVDLDGKVFVSDIISLSNDNQVNVVTQHGNKLTVNLEKDEYLIEIFNTQGALEVSLESPKEIDLDYLNDGLYFISIDEVNKSRIMVRH